MFEHRLQLKLRLLLVFTLVMLTSYASAQVGDFRNDLSIGINGGYQLNSIAFVPKVPQGMKGGVNLGLSARYVCEKYFNTICAVQMEINYAQSGWKEQILSKNDEPCISTITGEQLRYEREISYLQLPLLAHLGWGREVSGAKFSRILEHSSDLRCLKAQRRISLLTKPSTLNRHVPVLSLHKIQWLLSTSLIMASQLVSEWSIQYQK